MNTFTNPLSIKLSERAQAIPGLPATYNPDPYVMKYNGEYYAYTTAVDGVSVLHSKNLVDWTHLGYALSDPEEDHYWAPAVIYDNGTFYMYYSSKQRCDDDVHNEWLKVAVSNAPEGPYIHKKTLFDTFSIDAHVVKDADGGWVLFYSVNETLGIDGHRPGTVILADRLLDPFTPEGKPKVIVKPSIDEEIYEENRFGDGRDWHTIEGAFHIRRRGRHYVMYSGNAYTRPQYYIGYAVASDVQGQSMTDLDWHKFPDERTYEPLLCRSHKVEGVGHNSVVLAPNNVDQWVVYHGRDAISEERESAESELRQMRMDPLWWNGARMWVPGPSSEPQPAPSRPSFLDRFDRMDGDSLGEQWFITGGNWEIRHEEARQTSLTGKGMAMVKGPFNYAVIEVNLRWERSHMGGLYGVILNYNDEWNYTEVLLDVGKRLIIVEETMNGIRQRHVQKPVPDGFRFDAYHQLIIQKTGIHSIVQLDGVQTLEHTGNLEAGDFALCTHYTRACFDGIAVTRHFSLNQAAAYTGWRWLRAEHGSWRLEDGVLTGTPEACGGAGMMIIKPYGTHDSFCRFDAAAYENTDLLIELKGLGQSFRIFGETPNTRKQETTVTLLHQDCMLTVWVGREQLMQVKVEGSWNELCLFSEGLWSLEALEWTERAPR